MSVKRQRWTEGISLPAAVLLAALALVPYWNGLANDFTFDDFPHVRENAAVQHRSPAELVAVRLRPGPVWRPLTMLSYGANEALAPSARGYRMVNLALHAAVTLSAFALARIFLASTAAAFAAAAIFAVHPIHTEAVTSIVGRAELLAALAILGALLAAARALRPGDRHAQKWYALALLCFAAAPFAKESALPSVALVIALHVWIEPRASLRRRLSFVLPFLAVAALYPLSKAAVVGSFRLPESPDGIDNPLAYVPLGVRVRTALVVLSEYVQLLGFPLRLSADYSYAQIPLAATWWDPRLLLAALILATLATAVVIAFQRAPELAVAALFFLVPLGVTSNLPFAIGTIKAERLLYLPSLGWCLALGALFPVLARRRRAAAGIALAALVALLGVRTVVRNRDWRDNLTLFRATAAASPNSSKAHYNLGVALFRAGRFEDATLHFRRSLQIYPRYAEAAFAIGRIFDKEGLDGGAVRWYERALRMDWRLVRAHRGLARVRRRLGEGDTADAALLTALALEPGRRGRPLDVTPAHRRVDRARAGRLADPALALIASAGPLPTGSAP